MADELPRLPSAPVRLTGEGLVLREWEDADVPFLTALFDDPDVARRTPLATPFDGVAARAYVEGARLERAAGTRLHLAVTTGGPPLGEVLVGLGRGTIGYAVGPAHRGMGLAVRATRLLTTYAHDVLGLPTVLLEIEADNAASIGVARGAGYRPADREPVTTTSKGRSLRLHSWLHEAP